MKSQPVETVLVSLSGVGSLRLRYLAETRQFAEDISNKKPNVLNYLDYGDPYENRTRVFAVRGRRPNR